MSYNHRKTVDEAETYLLNLGKVVNHFRYQFPHEAFIHPEHNDPNYRWKNAGFAILKGEQEETVEQLEKFPTSIYTASPLQLAGFMHLLTEDCMETLLEHCDSNSFFNSVVDILKRSPTKYTALTHQQVYVEPWEVLAMRDIISYALTWIKTVKEMPKNETCVENVSEEDSTDDEIAKHMRAKRRKGRISHRSFEDLLAEHTKAAHKLQSTNSSTDPKLKVIAGIPGVLLLDEWYPLLNPSIRVNQQILNKVSKYLTLKNINPIIAMNALMNQMILQGNVQPPQNS